MWKQYRVKDIWIRYKSDAIATPSMQGKPCTMGHNAERDGCIPLPHSGNEESRGVGKESPGKNNNILSKFKPKLSLSDSIRHGLMDSFRREADSYNRNRPKTEMSIGDQLQALEDFFSKDEKSRPYLMLSDYSFILVDKLKEQGLDMNKMSNDELWKALHDSGYVVQRGGKPLKMEIRADNIIQHASSKERKVLLPYFANKLAETEGQKSNGFFFGEWFDAKLTPEENRLWADSLEKAANGAPLKTKFDADAKKEGLDYESGLTQSRVSVWEYTTNYDVFVNGFAANWALSGSGVNAQKTSNAVCRNTMPQNQGKSFWTKHSGTSSDQDYDLDRIAPHIDRMKKETETFYKQKLGKKNKNIDLATLPLTVLRGVGGAVSSYLPSPVESWTADPKTAERFGKMMGEKKGFTILQAHVTYNDVLFSYETMKSVPGWPAEKNLKGKKEFVVFGGALSDVKAETKR